MKKFSPKETHFKSESALRNLRCKHFQTMEPTYCGVRWITHYMLWWIFQKCYSTSSSQINSVDFHEIMWETHTVTIVTEKLLSKGGNYEKTHISIGHH